MRITHPCSISACNIRDIVDQHIVEYVTLRQQAKLLLMQRGLAGSDVVVDVLVQGGVDARVLHQVYGQVFVDTPLLGRNRQAEEKGNNVIWVTYKFIRNVVR